MIHDNLIRHAHAVTSQSLANAPSAEQWRSSLDQRRRQWRHMLGLDPLPPRTPLEATCTGVLDRGDYVVEKIHFQSVPGAYVAGNLYRPAHVTGPLPAVLYLCGHSKGKVNPPYQANPRWFGQHGYVAMVLDPIQLGECQGMHHGTYSEDRFDWFSRGYTPAGVEVWNAMRAFDYLQSRDDVDGTRLGVTGLSGGGAMSWFLGAADERASVVVPVCQSGTIEQVVKDRSMDGHCDCAFWLNTYRWCWPDVGALIAPRALLLASGAEDVLWRPYAFRDVAYRLGMLYRELDLADKVALVEDSTPHGYTPKLRRAIFEWFNRHLKGQTDAVTDDVTATVEPEENLWVFGGQLPGHDAMRTVDRTFVSSADVPLPTDGGTWSADQIDRINRLRATTFRNVAVADRSRIIDVRADGTTKALGPAERDVRYRSVAVSTADELTIRLVLSCPQPTDRSAVTVVCALSADERTSFLRRPTVAADLNAAVVEVRGTGVSSMGPGLLWTARRAYPLVGGTLPERQVSDLLAGIDAVRAMGFGERVAVYGQGDTAVLALYAAVLDPNVEEVILDAPPESHTDAATPELLHVLQVGDLPQNLGLVCPRPVTFVGEVPSAYAWTRDAYGALGLADRIRVVKELSAWRPLA